MRPELSRLSSAYADLEQVFKCMSEFVMVTECVNEANRNGLKLSSLRLGPNFASCCSQCSNSCKSSCKWGIDVSGCSLMHFYNVENTHIIMFFIDSTQSL